MGPVAPGEKKKKQTPKPNLLKFCIMLSMDPNAELMDADVPV